MTRVKSSVTKRSRVKKVLSAAKGFRGRRKNCYVLAKSAVARKMNQEFIGRKKRASQLQRVWNIRINSACRMFGTSYSKFKHAIRNSAFVLFNNRSLSEIAFHAPEDFGHIVKELKIKE